jgi:biopolymer transport protein ExbB
MMRTTRLPALVAALALGLGSMTPSLAQVQSAPAAATATAPPPPLAAGVGAVPALSPTAVPATATAAVPAGDAGAAIQAAAAATEAVENPYGLDALWKGGDFVARGTLIILVIMSAGTWYIMILKVFEQSRMLAAARAAYKNFWAAGSVSEGVTRLKPKSAFRAIAESGLRATEHHEGGLTEQIDLHTWVTMSLQRAVEALQSRLQGGLAFLATVGSTAPFVGLFGTVWGIYHALTAIGIAGQASIDKVAGPVGEALIMTAIGLATAVPAVLGYNWLVRRNKAVMQKVRNFSSDIHVVLLKAARTDTGKAGSGMADANVAAATRIA